MELSSVNRDRASNHDEEEAQQWYDGGDAVRKCRGYDETARVHRVKCRAAIETSWRQVVA